MTREKIKISDLEYASDRYLDDVEGIEVIKDEIVYVDSEKHIQDIEIIFQREIDGKFFKVEFQRWSHQGDLLEQTATEVFRKEIISYEYF